MPVNLEWHGVAGAPASRAKALCCEAVRELYSRTRVTIYTIRFMRVRAHLAIRSLAALEEQQPKEGNAAEASHAHGEPARSLRQHTVTGIGLCDGLMLDGLPILMDYGGRMV